MNIKELIEDSVNEVWSEFKKEDFCNYPPCSIAEIPNDGLIFIGINPSMDEKEKLRLKNKNDFNCEFYKLSYEVNKDYRYFKKFFDLAENTGMAWGHIDILYHRETKQKKVQSLLKLERGKDFLYK